MSNRRSPTRLRLESLLADGAWHSFDFLVRAAQDTVDLRTSARYYLSRTRKRDRSQEAPAQERLHNNLHESLATGTRYVIHMCLNVMRCEQRGPRGTREYRLPTGYQQTGAPNPLQQPPPTPLPQEVHAHSHQHGHLVRRAIDRLLSDGIWRTAHEITASVSHLISPEQAARTYIFHRKSDYLKRLRRHTDQDEHTLLQEALHTHLDRAKTRYIRAFLKKDSYERRIVNGVKEYRLPPRS